MNCDFTKILIIDKYLCIVYNYYLNHPYIAMFTGAVIVTLIWVMVAIAKSGIKDDEDEEKGMIAEFFSTLKDMIKGMF